MQHQTSQAYGTIMLRTSSTAPYYALLTTFYSLRSLQHALVRPPATPFRKRTTPFLSRAIPKFLSCTEASLVDGIDSTRSIEASSCSTVATRCHSRFSTYRNIIPFSIIVTRFLHPNKKKGASALHQGLNARARQNTFEKTCTENPTHNPLGLGMYRDVLQFIKTQPGSKTNRVDSRLRTPTGQHVVWTQGYLKVDSGAKNTFCSHEAFLDGRTKRHVDPPPPPGTQYAGAGLLG